jgi:hypothetical protein
MERARNVDGTWNLGDPERWGGTVTVTAAAGQRLTPGPQIVRVQVPELVARSWDIVAAWSISGWNPATDTLNAFGLAAVFGAGQTTDGGLILLDGRVAQPGRFLNGDSATDVDPQGTVQANLPVPAAALALSLVFIASTVAPLPRSWTVKVSAAVAPRALS